MPVDRVDSTSEPTAPGLLPPRATQRPHTVVSPHGERADPWYWLRDDKRADQDVLAQLHAENAYTEQVLAPAQPLIAQLYEEIVARLKQDDASVPVRWRGYWYSSRYAPGLGYPIFVRQKDFTGASAATLSGTDEEVLLDCNVLAAGQSFFQLGGYEVSPDNRLLAYTVDTVGRRQFQLFVLDLASRTLLPDVLDNVEGDVTWADDGSLLLYVEKDPVTLLGRRVRSHRLGQCVSSDALIYEEQDESFDLSVDRSKSDELLLIGAESTTSSEWRYARAGGTLAFTTFLPRSDDHEYQIEHLENRFLIRTNWDAENFRVMSVRVGEERDRSCWQQIVAHSPEVYVHDFEVFRSFIAISERAGALRKIRIQTWEGDSWHLDAPDAAYTMHLSANPELDVTQLRYVYSSLSTPASTYDYSIHAHSHTLLKREPVLGQFDSTDYVSELIWATARDGVKIPVSVVRRHDVALDGRAPLLVYAYGSYGLCIDPQFSVARLSLLNRGFVYAIAHVRGGQEMGRRWYNAGRLLNKWNTFHDFVDATEFLVSAGYGDRKRVFASGGSAGGLLMGVVMNVAPEKYAAIVANVPFVDVVTTMLDESIPLTTLEYDEWGDPREKAYYDYMLSYAPYDNVETRPHPPLLVTTGLWDSQVQYYEPVKWIARLRALNPDGAPMLLHTNMEAGHGGKSGRYEHVREIAREYGFIMHISDRLATR